jgi:hypothetical protein
MKDHVHLCTILEFREITKSQNVTIVKNVFVTQKKTISRNVTEREGRTYNKGADEGENHGRSERYFTIGERA